MLHGIDDLLYALFTVKKMVTLRRGVCNCRHPAAFFIKWNTLRKNLIAVHVVLEYHRFEILF